MQILQCPFPQVLRRLEQAGGMQTYVYDICAKKDCAAVFRCEHKDCTHCPKCNTSRFTDKGGARKKLYYLSIGQWLTAAWADSDIARCVMLPVMLYSSRHLLN